MTGRYVSLRRRSAEDGSSSEVPVAWDGASSAAVICDMWDTAQCISAARRVSELAPRVNEAVAHLRDEGALIVHAPGGCMAFYAAAPARERALRAPPVISPVPVDWNDWNEAMEAALPPTLSDETPCSCEPDRAPCTAGGPPYPWTHQIESIRIDVSDAVTDDGNELLALLEQRGIERVVVMGVHANRCVLGRPYGIRQLVYWGKAPVLCRDLTDSYHRDPRGHLWGNEQMTAHIERYWCPTTTSDQLAGGSMFQFRETQ